MRSCGDLGVRDLGQRTCCTVICEECEEGDISKVKGRYYVEQRD